MGRQATQDSVDLSVDATADLTALIDDLRAANGTRVWVTGAGATHGLWCLDQTSTATVDGVTVVATLSGVGRWFYFGGVGGAEPSLSNVKHYGAVGDGVTDDTAAIQAAINANAGVRAIYFPAGIYVFGTLGGCVFKADTGHVFEFAPGVELRSTQVPGGDTAFLFHHEAVLDNSGGITLTADAIVGSNQLAVSAPIAIGTRIFVGQTPGISEYWAAQYVVTNYAAGIATVDTLIDLPHKNTDKVQVITGQARDIVFRGNGCKWTGTVDRFVRVLGALRVHFEDVREEPTAGTPHGLSYDLACKDCSADRIVGVLCGRVVTLEACQRFALQQISGYRCGYTVLAYDSVDGDLIQVSGTGTGIESGVALVTNPGNTVKPGCSGVRGFGGRVGKMTTGYNFGQATDCFFAGAEAEDCTTNFAISSGGVRCTYFSPISRRATSVGYLNQGSMTKLVAPTSVGDLRALKCDTFTDEFDIIAPDFSGYTGSGCRFDLDGARVTFKGGRVQTDTIDMTAFDFANGGGAGGALVTLDDVTVALGTTGGGGSFGFYHRAAVNLKLTLRNVKMTQAGANAVGYSGSAGSELRTEGRNDLNVTTPVTLNGALADFGEFTLNGVNEVDVPGAFPVDATIEWSLKTVGGTPGNAQPYFDKAQIAGHFYVKSPTAGANDTYRWRASGGI